MRIGFDINAEAKSDGELTDRRPLGRGARRLVQLLRDHHEPPEIIEFTRSMQDRQLAQCLAFLTPIVRNAIFGTAGHHRVP